MYDDERLVEPNDLADYGPETVRCCAGRMMDRRCCSGDATDAVPVMMDRRCCSDDATDVVPVMMLPMLFRL